MGQIKYRIDTKKRELHFITARSVLISGCAETDELIG